MMIWRLADFECLAVNGIRIGVDSGSKVNLRLNMGFGPDGIKGFNINVAEAF